MTKKRTVPPSDSRSGIGYVIAVQVAAGIVLAVWTVTSGASAAVTGVLAATLIAGWWCGTRIRAIRSSWTRIMFGINGSRGSHLREPVGFTDIPAAGGPLTDTLVVSGARPREAPGIGVPVPSGVLVTTIRVRPPSPAVRYLDRTGRDSGPGAELSLAPEPLAACLAQFDIALHSIDIVVHTRSEDVTGPVSRSYANTLGPIRTSPQTSTYVLIRLDPRDCPEAITRRGGGAEGTARALAVATRRVAARITEQGLAADILSADDASGVLRELAAGQDPAKLRESWDHVRSGPLRYRTFPLDRGGAAERYAAIDTATHPAAHPAGDRSTQSRDGDASGTVSTTTVIGLTGTADAPCVRAVTRVIGAEPATGRGDGPTDTHALCGHQADALLTGLPHPRSHSAWRHITPVRGSAARQLVQRISLPCSGSGQLLGADAQGRPVALTLAGPGVSRVVIDAHRPLAAQIVLRAIATGAQVVVHSADPRRWDPMLTAVDDPDRLGLAPVEHEHSAERPRVEVYDGLTPPADSAGVTIFHLAAGGEAATRPADAPASTVFIRQHPHDQRTFSVDTHTGTTVISVVAVDDEWLIINGRTDSPRPGPHRPPVPPAPPAPPTPAAAGRPTPSPPPRARVPSRPAG